MKVLISIIQCFFLTVSLAPASQAWARDSGPNTVSREITTLTVGKVSTQPRKHFLRFRGLADFLAENLNDLGVTEVKVLFAKNNEEMIDMLKKGGIDFISETMFSSMLYVEKAGAEILVREWRNNVPEYHTVFFARKDSGIKTLTDLKGKILAFEDPGSTSAYFLPRSVLMREKIPLKEMGWPVPKPGPAPVHDVGYVFAKTEDNIPIWVHEDRVQAGVLSNTDWVDEGIVPQKIKKDLVIFYETESVPRSLLLAGKGLPKKIRDRVKQRLLDVYGEEKNLEVIKKFSEVTKYDRVPSSEVKRFQSLYNALKSNLNK